MQNSMTWAYFLQLSDHMWADEYTESPEWFLPKHRYRPENRIDPATWDCIISFIAQREYNMVVVDVGDGLQFDSHPEISAPDAWSKEQLRKKLQDMRQLGLEPIPKLNFSTRHDTWLKEYRFQIGTPVYYNVCADLIREVCQVFDHPRLFHVGLDEETRNLGLVTGMIAVRHDDLFWQDALFLFRECEKNGARPWAWADRYWTDPTGFTSHMPTSVILSTCFYGYMRDIPDKTSWKYNRAVAFQEFDRLGYDQIPCCSDIEFKQCILQTVAHGKQKLSAQHLAGFLVAPWTNTEARHEFRLKNDAHKLYAARKRYFPETLSGGACHE